MKLSAIKKQCEQKFLKASNETASDAEKIITESYDDYYEGGYPIRYERTYKLRGATKINASISSTSTHIEAGYDPGAISYDTGTPGYPVFEATAEGFGGTVGNEAYDEDALEDVQRAAEENFGAQFG